MGRVPSLTVPLDQLDIGSLLDDWQWLLRAPHEVLVVTSMGDAFVANEAGAVFFLDTLEGSMERVASSREAFSSLMNGGGYNPDWFNADMLALKAEQGAALGRGQCYSYSIPPVVGGSLASENVVPTDAIVHFSLSGQLHRQTVGLPEGARISGFRLVKPDESAE